MRLSLAFRPASVCFSVAFPVAGHYTNSSIAAFGAAFPGICLSSINDRHKGGRQGSPLTSDPFENIQLPFEHLKTEVSGPDHIGV
jgi:hypothetical protein